MTKRTLAQSVLRPSRFARIASEFALFFVCLVASTAAQTPATPDAPADVSASSSSEAPTPVADVPNAGDDASPPSPAPQVDAPADAPFIRRTSNLREKPTFWLSDENGAWRVPLPNWSLEEVMQTIDGDEPRDDRTPYSIQKINAFGSVKNGVARLDVVFTVQVFGDELVRVPLGLQEGVYIPVPNGDGSASPDLNDGFAFEGPEGSECELDVDGETGAYLALVRPPREERNAASSDDANARRRNDDASGRRRARQYQLTLQLCFAVETLGVDEQRLVATFPPSVNSQLLLAAPLQDAKFKSVKGAIQGAATPMDESTTYLTLHGLGRGAETTDVVWRKSKSAAEQNVVVYQVEDASIDVRLDARETVCEATLPVRVFGGETDAFKIRLPARASLVRDETFATDADGAAFEIRDLVLTGDGATPDSSSSAGVSDADADAERSQTLEIKLAQKTNSAILKIKTRTPAPENASSGETGVREISGFEVDGAQKQRGRVKISKAEGLDFNVVPLFGARVDVENAPALEDGEELYLFSAQPFALNAQPFVRRVVVNVKPEYQVVVGEKEATLRAKFQYSIYGAKISEFKINLRDWEFAGLASDGLVDVLNIEFNETTGETTFPLLAPTDGVVEFELTAGRELDASEDGAFAFSFPTPSASWLEPSTVVVAPVDAVELTPTLENCVDLTPKPLRALAPTLELPPLQQAPFVYQTRRRGDAANDAPPLFAARAQKQEQKIEIESKTDVYIDENGSQRVEQRFVYRVEREPLDSISLVSHALGGKTAPNLKISVDGKAVPPQNLTVESVDENQTRRRVSLADSPKIGSCVVSLQYEGETLEFDANSTRRVNVNLAQPEDGALLSNELTLYAPPSVALEYVENPKRFWRLEESGRSADGRSTFQRFSSATQEFGASFGGSLNAKDNFGSVVVDRAWLQTWLSDDARVDRVAYRLSGRRDRLAIRLPNDVRQDRVAVSLDGVPFANVADAKNGLFADAQTLVVPIAESVRDREYVLEISYVVQPNSVGASSVSGVSSSKPNANRLEVQFPRFVRLPNDDAQADSNDGAATARDLTDDSVWVRRAYWQILTPYNRHIAVDPSDWTPEYVLRRDGFLGSYRRVASTSQTELCDWIGVSEREPIPLEVNSYLFSGFGQPERSRLYVLDRALLILLGGGAALATGLGLLYLPFLRSRSALFLFALTTTALVALRPYLAFLFLQTTVFGVVLTLAAALLAKFFGRKEA
ncbi:MAG: hypothetical protein J6K20_00555, partial [Thermoguttaceae bacterium]|nr:hypothetical protein [Thermoguttaceae bacterium]